MVVLKEKKEEGAIEGEGKGKGNGNGNGNGSGPTKFRILVLPLGGSTVVPITTASAEDGGLKKKKQAKSAAKTSVVTEQQPSASADNNEGGRDCSINLTIPSNISGGGSIGGGTDDVDEDEDDEDAENSSGDRLCEKLCRCCQLYLQMAFGGTALILFAGLCAALVEGYDGAVAFTSLLLGALVFLVLFALCCCQCCDLVLTALIEKALVAADAAHRRKYGKTVAERHRIRIRRQQQQLIQDV
ncbi:hypothetical protein TYRP_016311 [Tyrophagus putrescentiae]|nr:hypothetical protein TYRP_016311 [Tyrophagus putrescentiae]